MIINHNIAALNTYRQLTGNATAAQKNMAKLSSGLRINSAADDAAGLGISEKMRNQIRGLEQASRNAQDGISLIQTAESGLDQIHSILQRMRELAVQSSNDTLQQEERDNIQEEMNQLAREITRTSETTEFNGRTLMKSGATFNGKFQIGANENQTLDLSINAMSATDLSVDGGAGVSASASEVAFVSGDANEFTTENVDATNYTQSQDLEIKVEVTDAASGTATFTITQGTKTYTAAGVVTDTGTGAAADDATFVLSSTTSGLEELFKAGESIEIKVAADLADGDEANIKITGASGGSDGIDVSSQANASAAIATIDTAIKTVSEERAKLGAVQNRLEFTINNLGSQAETLTASESRIRDVDMAKEIMEFTKNNILNQAAQAMLAQANQQPQQVLQLLR